VYLDFLVFPEWMVFKVTQVLLEYPVLMDATAQMDSLGYLVYQVYRDHEVSQVLVGQKVKKVNPLNMVRTIWKDPRESQVLMVDQEILVLKGSPDQEAQAEIMVKVDYQEDEVIKVLRVIKDFA
jgi:hypothetical protein